MELETATFDLPLAIDNARTFVRERAANHGITLDVKVDERLGDIVGDERKIKQILLNLLSNAVKFTPEGGRITINARPTTAVEISVTDTGIGIAEEDQPKIFEEFRQVGSDTAKKIEGTGLGLTLAKKFVELHGGRIWVESEVGKGSTFVFYFAGQLGVRGQTVSSRKIRSTNFEIRNKFGMMKSNAMIQTKSNRIRCFEFSRFGIYLAAVCFEFRASDFGFSFFEGLFRISIFGFRIFPVNR